MRCRRNGSLIVFLVVLGVALALTILLPVKCILFVLAVLLGYLSFMILTRF